METNHKLIISLIKDNLINTKLIESLSEIGLLADIYSLHLSDTIFDLMGIGENEDMFELFMKLNSEAIQTDFIKYPHLLNGLAEGICNSLKTEMNR